jgi:hypothetical protein
MNVVKRMQAPTPRFFRVLRKVGIGLIAAGGALLTAPVAVPAVVLTIAEYLTVAGTVMTAVSQTAVAGDDEPPQPEPATGRQAD